MLFEFQAKAKAHNCRKNHEASSKLMEPAAAVELSNKDPDQSVKPSVLASGEKHTYGKK